MQSLVSFQEEGRGHFIYHIRGKRHYKDGAKKDLNSGFKVCSEVVTNQEPLEATANWKRQEANHS